MLQTCSGYCMQPVQHEFLKCNDNCTILYANVDQFKSFELQNFPSKKTVHPGTYVTEPIIHFLYQNQIQS